MLGRKTYTRKKFDHSYAEIVRQLAAYTKLAKAGGATTDKKAGTAFQAFESLFVLARPFVHRFRMVTGKDGRCAR